MLGDAPPARGSRRVGCPQELWLSVMAADPSMMVITELAPHRLHVPRSKEDERHLRLLPEVVAAIEDACR
jgi:hypothetical protein